MKKFLLALADKPTPQFPEKLLRYLDRYVRPQKHRHGVSAWTLVARERSRRQGLGFAY